MRLHRMLVVLAITGALWAPRNAAAVCDAFGPYLGSGLKLPLGCPLHVFGQPGPFVPLMPTISALRNGTYVDVTGAVTTMTASLMVERSFANCDGSIINTQQMSEPYQHFAIPPNATVQVGEQIGFSTGWFTGIEIVAAAPCPTPALPTPMCTEVPFCPTEPPFDDLEPGGCAARGGGGLAVGLALIGLRRRAPRRRRR